MTHGLPLSFRIEPGHNERFAKLEVKRLCEGPVRKLDIELRGSADPGDPHPVDGGVSGPWQFERRHDGDEGEGVKPLAFHAQVALADLNEKGHAAFQLERRPNWGGTDTLNVQASVDGGAPVLYAKVGNEPHRSS